MDRLVALAGSALAAPAATFEGIEFYPEFAQKAALVYSRLARNHPLPDGSKRVAYLCMIEFIERNGYAWDPTTIAEASLEETIQVLKGTAAGTIAEKDFVEWVRTHIKTSPDPV